jgi:hypothetical protein
VTCTGANGTGEGNNVHDITAGAFGDSVALSADGTTALIGAPNISVSGGTGAAGATWVFTQQPGATWSQQSELCGEAVKSCNAAGTGEDGNGLFGSSVALSADGSTALIGAPADASEQGAVWAFTQTAGAWSQQDSKLVAGGEIGAAMFGNSVAVSGDGTEALIGGPDDNNYEGAAWVFAQSGGAWSQQTELLGDCTSGCGGSLGTGEIGAGTFGYSVALSADGNTALVGGPNASGYQGAAWMFMQSGGTWSQQTELYGDCAASCTAANASGEIGGGQFGQTVALAGTDDVVAIGAPSDNVASGGVWITAATPGVQSPPVVTGTPAAGQILSCSPGSWDNSPTGFNYQWNSDNSTVGGATSSTYTVQPEDLGNTITCSVTAFNADGASLTATSNAIVVPPPTPIPISLPSILPEGTHAGDQLACLNGNWTNNPYDFNYQWNRDGVPIPNATDAIYTIAPLDEGSSLTCAIVAIGATATSAPVPSSPFSVPIPRVRGCPAADGALGGTTLGLVRLGMTPAQARRAYKHSTDTRGPHTDQFCLTPLPVTVGYGTAKLLTALPAAARKRLNGKLVWAASGDPRYTVAGVRIGASTPPTVIGLRIVQSLQAGASTWYVLAGRSAAYLVQASGGQVQELAVVNSQLVQRAATLRVLVSQIP